MLRRILAIFILSLFIASVEAVQLLPYQGSVRPQIEANFKSLQKAFLVGKGEEFAAYKDLLSATDNVSEEVEVWRTLVYCQILIESDSVQKSEQILENTHELGIAWLESYRTYLKGVISIQRGQHIMANAELLKAYAEIKEGTVLKVLIQQAIAENLRIKGDLDESLKMWFEALTASETLKDSIAIADTYLGRGITRLALSEFELAEQDILISQAYFSRVKAFKKMSECYSELALMSHLKRDYQNSIDFGLRGYEISKELNDIKGQAESLNNMALAYMGLENWNQAMRYLDQAIQLASRTSKRQELVGILNNLGICHQQLGNLHEALNYFQLALTKGKESGNTKEIINSYRNISNHYSSVSDYESAYYAQVRLAILTDSLALLNQAQTMEELEFSHDIDKKEQEILFLKQEKKIITNRWLNLALALFLLIIIGILFIDNQKRKHRQEKDLLNSADELQKTELRRMSEMLAFNRNKLSLYTENLIKKSELVSQLESKLRNTVDGSPESFEQGEKLIADFSSVRILTDDDWVEFKELFDEVHKGLLDRLLKFYPDLSLAEQRLFLLMKLKLSTKEIANILGVSPDSVKKGRYRLKKKVSIEEATSLQDFVTSF
ncbi:MAG: tetratricopeptide repeat protein [Flavobacteriales bacterium]|nr:tetratricopeptide repeat protein [Flavobacteriales bacterium]